MVKTENLPSLTSVPSDSTIERTLKDLLRIMYGVQSDYKNIYKEKLVYDYKDLLAGMGGTLSLFIGFAIFNIYEGLLDKTIKGIKRFQRRIFEVKDSKKSHDESISTSSTTDILPVEPYTLVSVFTPEGTEEKLCV